MIKQKNYNSYQIKKGDTLNNIAEALGKDSSEVARFHNIYAKQEELIGKEFPKNLISLYITPNISEKHIESIPKVNFLYDKKLALKPFKKLIYDSNIYYTSTNQTTVLSSEKTVTYLQKTGEYHLIEIDTLANDEDLNGISLELSAEIAKTLYPLQLVVNEQGNWIGIYKFELLEKRWHNIKQLIRGSFEGIETEKRITFYDTLFNNEARCTQLLRKDIFLQAYFNNLYANHSRGFYFERKIEVDLIPNCTPVCYALKQEVEEYLNDTNQIEVIQKGIYADARSLLDFHYNLDKAYYAGDMPTGSYNTLYTLNSESNCIEKIRLDCNLEINTPIEITAIIELKQNN